jgi:hypothetical protein
MTFWTIEAQYRNWVEAWFAKILAVGLTGVTAMTPDTNMVTAGTHLRTIRSWHFAQSVQVLSERENCWKDGGHVRFPLKS